MNILIIEKNRETFIKIKKELNKANNLHCNVFYELNFHKALKSIRSKKYDICLIANNLYNKTALDFILEAGDYFQKTPALVMAEKANYEEDLAVMEAGASCYLAADEMTPEKLERIIRYTIRNKTIENELREENKINEDIAAVKLKNSDEKFRALVENSRNLIMRFDKEYRHLYVNPISTKMLGIAPEVFINKTHDELGFPPDLSKYWDDLIQKVFDERKSNEVVFKLEAKGKTLYLDWQLSPEFDKNGNVASVMTTAHDITYLKEAEKALKENEEQYRILVENAGEGIIIAQESCIKFYNEKMGEIIGNKDEILGRPIISYIVPEEREKIGIMHQRRIAGEKVPETYESVLLSTTNRRIPAEFTSVLTKYKSKPAVLTFVRDITSRKKAEEKLKSSLDLQEAILKNSLVGILYLEGGRYIAKANDKLCQIIGYSREEIIGQSAEIFHLSKKHFLEFGKKYFSHLSKEEVVDVEYQMKRKDGKIIWVRFSGKALHFGNPDKGVIWACEDITEQHQIIKELIRSRENADRANKAKSVFLANMSHEIRTPMNAVIGFAQLLDKTISDKKQKGYIKNILSGGNSLLTLINDILDISKIEAGKMEIRKREMRPRSLFEEIISIFKLKLEENKIKFITDIDEKLPEKIILDETKLRQILFNIIGNAVKFTENGSVEFTVKTNKSKDQNNFLDLIIVVKDTGIGIPESSLESIFEFFKQHDEHDSRKYGGSGLGLTITKRLVEMMNGKISVESKLGQGSMFTILLKNINIPNDGINKAEQDCDIYTADKSELDNKNYKNIDNVFFEKSSILVVDDIEFNRMIIRELFSNSQIKIEEAESGQEALEMVKKVKPDLILMDIKMPEMDGYETLKRIREDESFRSVPIIALTASALLSDQDKMKKSGFDGYLSKPFEMKKLFQELCLFLPFSTAQDRSGKSKETSELTFSKIDNRKLLEVIKLLENGYMKLWKRVNGGFFVEEIEDFGKNLKKLGINYTLDVLIDYGEDLVNYSNNFEINELVKLLNNYPEVINKIKKMITTTKTGRIEDRVFDRD